VSQFIQLCLLVPSISNQPGEHFRQVGDFAATNSTLHDLQQDLHEGFGQHGLFPSSVGMPS
jgi:hypothetical protein